MREINSDEKFLKKIENQVSALHLIEDNLLINFMILFMIHWLAFNYSLTFLKLLQKKKKLRAEVKRELI